ncbi:anti-sigma factor family protein [Glaciecola petra]|uniref:Zf-HC2 domain-containing protein n=1 Tax=Glaciecola petra TaxID=3075602 RepID=A0ABU2ZSN7_9ALTE|nr:zf-HC2 domain-containing protein [Aestuariibacter sp. P117]MDT0595271.1 zf-HC2 domain-containing protein [Aestuariibacter sp. P117]
MSHLNKCEHIAELLSGYADNELTQQQSQLVQVHIENCESCKQALANINILKQAVKGTAMPEIEQDKIDAMLNDPKSKTLQIIGFSAMIIGVCIALAFATFTFMTNPSIGLGEKLVNSLIWGGLVGVFISVLRQQLIARKTDKYKGVKL